VTGPDPDADTLAGDGEREDAPPRGRRWDGLLPFAGDVVRLLRDVAADDRVSRRAKAVAGAAAAYVVSPLDPIPDVIPVVGWVDDAVVLGLALRYLLRHAGYELIREHWSGTDDGFALVLFVSGVQR
jgi:uncharacterized membrane protein YkvA (DUF1232 family)